MSELKDKTLHMIGNAHLDPVWLWQWQEGFQAAKATFRSALDRLRESDDFLFTSSSAATYEWIEQTMESLTVYEASLGQLCKRLGWL